MQPKDTLHPDSGDIDVEKEIERLSDEVAYLRHLIHRNETATEAVREYVDQVKRTTDRYLGSLARIHQDGPLVVWFEDADTGARLQYWSAADSVYKDVPTVEQSHAQARSED